MDKIWKSLVVLFFGVVSVFCLCGYASADSGNLAAAPVSIQQANEITTQQTSFSINKMRKYAKVDGYKNIKKWYKKFKTIRKAKIAKIKEQIKLYRPYLSNHELEKVLQYKERFGKAHTIKHLREIRIKANKIFRKARLEKEKYEAEQAYWQSFDGKSKHVETLTAWGGVYYYGGRTETYYSSRILYHYMTPQWICDGEGFWRTGEGYYVVAASDMAYGTVFEGSKGWCMVLDSGCAYGVTDYYVSW